MPGLEASFGKTVSFEQSKVERLMHIKEEARRKQMEGGVPTLEENLAYIVQTREVLLDEVAELERLRHEYRALPDTDHELMDTLIKTRSDLLDPFSVQDIRAFQNEDAVLRDRAQTLIAYLEQLNQVEITFMKKSGSNTEESANKARVREAHINVISREWNEREQ